MVAHADGAPTPSGRAGVLPVGTVAEGDVAAMRVREDDTMNEAVPWERLACRFGCDPNNHPVVGLYFAPHGCQCYPDHIQALCGKHAIKGQQNNAMTAIIECGEFRRRRKHVIRLTREQRNVLRRMAEGWRPLQIQLGGEGRKLERRGLIKIDWGPDYSRDADKLCAYLTDRGREALL